MKTTVYLALGSNLGDRAANLRAVWQNLAPAARPAAASRVYETPPWGYTDQPAFLNQVIRAETDLPPLELLAALKQLETQLGRVPGFRNGPRAIDIDILFYGDQVVEMAGLSIPHPRLAERAFVLVPLADLAPDLRHPFLDRSIRQLLDSVDQSGIHGLPYPLPWGSRTFVMGVLNLTPDSFSGDGLIQPTGDPLHAALEQARRFAAAGADILDVGGESTRPGSQPVGESEELERVLPVIRALAAELDVLISIDTYKASVAEQALQAGADWINDVWGLRADPRLAEVAARQGAPVILMHNRSRPADAEVQARLGGRYVGVQYENLLEDVAHELMQSVALARSAGVLDGHIILDPGIGFGKTVEQNLELVDRLGELRGLGFPILLGPSRKGFIGYTLNLPPDQRVEGTAAAVAVGIARGADIVRVHDVEPMLRVARMTDAIVRRVAQKS